MTAVRTLPAESVHATSDDDSGEIAVATFRGTTSELQAFVERTWCDTYSGKMAFPVWSSDYFDWQFAQHDSQPDRRLAVYRSSRLLGVLAGAGCRFQTPKEVLSGAHWSWLSVDSAVRGRGLAKLLDKRRFDIERSVSSDLVVSYRFTGSRHSLAERPSMRFPLKKFHNRIGFWARPLDCDRLRSWNINRVESALTRITAPVLPKLAASDYSGALRNFHAGDIGDCVALMQRETQRHALAILWDEKSLRHQLAGSPVTQTLVAETNGSAGGFINYHILPFQGRTREPVGVIDIVAIRELSPARQQALLLAALRQMRDQGAILALKLRCGDVSPRAMLRAGFIPRLPDSHVVLQWTNVARAIPRRGTLHVLWR